MAAQRLEQPFPCFQGGFRSASSGTVWRVFDFPEGSAESIAASGGCCVIATKNSPCHVDSITSTWRSHHIPLFPRVRSMWQVYIDNLVVLEVCDRSDVQELCDSCHHEGMIIARERYKHFHVPRSPGKAVVRVLHTKALGDHGLQSVVSPPAFFVRELNHFTLVTLFLLRVGRKWMQIPAGRWVVRVFPFRREGMSCFNEAWIFLYSCHGSQVLPSVVRQQLLSALLLLTLLRADLRVPVDPSVKANDASLSGGGSGLGSCQAGASEPNEFV